MPGADSIKRGFALIENDNSKVLGLTVGKNTIATPGQYVPKAEAQSPPELSFTVPDPDLTYIAISIDIDAPFPQFGILGPILHWIQPGLKAGPSAQLVSNDPFVANWIAPAPPIQLGGPHRYIVFLYEQPAAFDAKRYAPADGKMMGIGPRVRWDLDVFETKAGLGPILAFSYFKSN